MDGNTLFPIFIKPDQLPILVVGGGPVAQEKLEAILRQNCKANITIVTLNAIEEVHSIAAHFTNVRIIIKAFEGSDIIGKSLVIAATNNKETNHRLRKAATEMNTLLNVADKPELCDFYLGSIVKKGDLKLAISTNGKSPTLAKRLREYFSDVIPDEIDEVLQELHTLRNQLQGDFKHKVETLNEVTRDFVAK